MRFTSHYNGKTFAFEVDDKQLLKAPVWDTHQGHPPLDARKAVGLARTQLRDLVEDSQEWKLKEIALRESPIDGRWLYLIRCHPPMAKLKGLMEFVEIPVLMDGTTVKADVSARKF